MTVVGIVAGSVVWPGSVNGGESSVTWLRFACSLAYRFAIVHSSYGWRHSRIIAFVIAVSSVGLVRSIDGCGISVLSYFANWVWTCATSCFALARSFLFAVSLDSFWSAS